MDLERLPPAVPCTGSEQIQDDLDRDPVYEGKLRTRGYGRDYGGADLGGHSGHHLLPVLPEAYYQRRGSRRGERIINWGRDF